MGNGRDVKPNREYINDRDEQQHETSVAPRVGEQRRGTFPTAQNPGSPSESWKHRRPTCLDRILY